MSKSLHTEAQIIGAAFTQLESLFGPTRHAPFPRRLHHFPQRLLQNVPVERQVGNQPLQLAVRVAQLAHLAPFADLTLRTSSSSDKSSAR